MYSKKKSVFLHYFAIYYIITKYNIHYIHEVHIVVSYDHIIITNFHGYIGTILQQHNHVILQKKQQFGSLRNATTTNIFLKAIFYYYYYLKQFT